MQAHRIPLQFVAYSFIALMRAFSVPLNYLMRIILYFATEERKSLILTRENLWEEGNSQAQNVFSVLKNALCLCFPMKLE